jgi:multifunctional methyltransferase subunit TRM112
MHCIDSPQHLTLCFSCSTTKGYPLIIDATAVVIEESPVDRDLILATMPKLDYSALLKARSDLADADCCKDESIPALPEVLPTDLTTCDDGLIADLSRIVFDVHVMEGKLICPDTKREFIVKDGIPNMIMHEDEI